MKMKDGPEEYNEGIDFFKEFENLMEEKGKTWGLSGDGPKALLAVREYCNADYSHLSKTELMTLHKKIAMACHEILERNCWIGK